MTAKKSAILSALIIAAAASVAVYCLNTGISPLVLFLFFAGLTVSAYLIILMLVSRYVQRRLMPLYRSMYGLNDKQAPAVSGQLDTALDQSEVDLKDWTEKKIEQIKTLQERDDFRREFIGNLAHELKTPLFNVQGFVSSLLEGAMDDESVKERFLIKANKNVDRMTRIIDDLDVIAKLEAEALSLVLVPINIVDSVNEVIDNLGKLISERKTLVSVNASSEIMVMADELRINQVLTNLIRNAVVYGHAAGKLRVDFTDLADRILIEVSDNGPGIEADKMPRLFERFYRVDSSRSRDIGGTGLGLSIVKHLVEAHGQTVSAKSSVGQGSSFSFTLSKAR